MPQVNPTDGTSVIEDVVVTATRRLEGYVVVPPFPADDNSGPLPSETPEAPEPPQELDEDCRRLAALNRAVLHAASLIGADDEESGYLLVRRPDVSIQAIGPIPGRRHDEVNWFQFPASYGLENFSQVVGLVHNHPRRDDNGPGLDANRERFSEADADVSDYFLSAGVSSEFRQYIAVNAKVLAFENDAAEGDRGSEISAIQCPGARLS